VRSDVRVVPPSSRAGLDGHDAGRRQATVHATGLLTTLMHGPRQCQRGLLSHRQHEQRVGRERRRPHRHPGDLAVHVPQQRALLDDALQQVLGIDRLARAAGQIPARLLGRVDAERH
jgi:hypothetical protein